VALSETSTTVAAPPLGENVVALDPPRAYGAPLGRLRVRGEPEDFCVEECLGFEPAGAGAHVLLWVRKRDANTTWVVEELAECPLALVATGADRDDTIVLRDPFA
jgi:tRNA pseudouridine13 synthase